MGLESVQSGKLLYHLTTLDNLKAIIQYGLMPRKILLENNCSFSDVADPGIMSKREILGLDIYTPFHFHPYSAFDVAVKNTYICDVFVYICIKRALAQFNNFKILVKHPLSQEECILYDYDIGIEKIDWETMKQAGNTDDYSKQVKMAECLTDKIIPADLFQCIYVPNVFVKQQVEDILEDNGITEQPPYVNVQGHWFL